MLKSQKILRFKPLASRYARAKARLASGIPLRRRGGQPGNTNRLIHGRYAGATLARRAHVRNLVRNARDTIAEMKLVKRVVKIFRLIRDVDQRPEVSQRIETRRAIRDAYAAGVFG